MTKILVIEDNEEILEEVLTWLMLEDYEALGATDGEEGVALAMRECPDLILSDIMMPKKDGHRVLLELRTNPVTALIPFIFTTAKQAKMDIRYGMELGADDYITKPFGRQELLSAIQTRLSRSKLWAHQSEQRVTELRNGLLSRLPHELRTPLIGILGVGELLGYDAESLTAAEITEYADIITTSGQQLYRLVENHLLYAQLELQAMSSVPATICDPNVVTPLADVVRTTCQRLLAEKHRAQYATTMDLDLQMALVHLSPDDIAKITYELVDNACKFSAPATPITVSGKVTPDGYQLNVTDHGRGIAPENLTRIGAFVQFERGQYEQQGSGLGLAIVQRLVQLANGTLHIDSTPAVGTTVTVTLPLA